MANTTQVTLIMRLGRGLDPEAWSQFVDVYGPLIYRFGRRRGLQDADAADVSQDVLREVARCMDRFQYDPSVGRFRDWLFLVARRRLQNFFRQAGRHTPGSGDTRVHASLQELEGGEEQADWDQEYRQQLFQWACKQVQAEFEERTWQAFWQTAVEAKKPASVGEALGMKVGSVYVAKNRVISRLRECIASVESGELEWEKLDR